MSDHDEQLLRLIGLAGAARAGSAPELELLLTASAGLVHAIARARLGDTEDADAAAVDALTRVATSFPSLKDPVAYPRWLHRIAIRTAIDTMRLRRSKPAALDGAGAVFARGRGDAVADEHDGGPLAEPSSPVTPVDTVVAAERAAAVRAAVAALPANQREPLHLHFVEGLTYREIARATGIGLATVDRRMRAGMERLRKRLRNELEQLR